MSRRVWLAAVVMLVVAPSRSIAQAPAPAEAPRMWTLEDAIVAALASAASRRPRSSTAESGFPLVVRLAPAYRGTPEAIGQLMITTPSGGEAHA